MDERENRIFVLTSKIPYFEFNKESRTLSLSVMTIFSHTACNKLKHAEYERDYTGYRDWFSPNHCRWAIGTD